MATAPNWRDSVEFTSEVFQVTPTIDCSDTIARTTGKWTVRIIWLEWCRPDKIKAQLDELIADNWVVEEFSSPAKPQEELDLMNTTIVAKKRVKP